MQFKNRQGENSVITHVGDRGLLDIQRNGTCAHPTNPLVNPLLTDKYQVTMAYGYWYMGRQDVPATFDLFFRKNPFGGEFTVFAGIDEVLKFVESYHFNDAHIEFVRKQLPPTADPRFFDYLRGLDCSQVELCAQPIGAVFPRVPLIRADGPLGITQLLETTMLNLTNYPSLLATNAMRMRLAAGRGKTLLEFGLRRAQGPDGGISASKYSYWGGFDGTSNMLASALFDDPCSGTHAHAWVLSFGGFEDIPEYRRMLLNKRTGRLENFVDCVLKWRKTLKHEHTHEGELAAFTAYALAFPDNFLALVDTYNTLESGVPNFICVAMALMEFGCKPLGIRLDSGHLAHLSRESRTAFREASEQTGYDISNCKIAASNDINEKVLRALNEQGHDIDIFGIGTNLVTCEAQPALGGVYKLVHCGGRMPIKLAEDKTTIPGKKEAYRLYNSEGKAVDDLMVLVGEEPPQPGKRVLCRHPFIETKRMYVVPSRVLPLHRRVWDGKQAASLPPASEIREYVMNDVYGLRADHTQAVNPTPYKVSVSEQLYQLLHHMMESESPIPEIV